MIQIGNKSINGKPWIVVGFSDLSPELINLANKLDMAELRLDLFTDLTKLDQYLPLLKNTPKLLTIRTKYEGGNWQDSEDKRIELFAKYISQVDMLDIELSATGRQDIYNLARNSNILVQFSHHDFNSTPNIDTLNSLLFESKQQGGDIFKIAATINSDDDMHTLVEFLQQNRQDKLVVIGMGVKGKLSRVFFPALGSLYTFTYVGDSTAPGQINLAQTIDLFDEFY